MAQPPSNTTLTSLDLGYVILTNLTCFASMMSCLAIAGFYLKYPDVRTTGRKLLLHLSAANFLQCLGSLLQSAVYYKSLELAEDRSLICKSAAYITVVGQIASALWTSMICVYLLIAVTFRAVQQIDRLVFVFYMISWVLPVLIATDAGFSDVYGYQISDILEFDHPSICWISDRVESTLEWYFLTGEVWIIATFFIAIIVFVVISCSTMCQERKMKNVPRSLNSLDEQEIAIKNAYKHLRYVPVIYCFLRVWGTGHFLFTEYPTKRHLRAFDWLLVIRAVGDNAQGLVNCIMFCITAVSIRLMLFRVRRRWCSCCTSWWYQNQHNFMKNERWLKNPIVRIRHKIQRKPRALDGSDLDISGISLDLPSEEDNIQLKYTEDEILFER